jgi:hypothetical protein
LLRSASPTVSDRGGVTTGTCTCGGFDADGAGTSGRGGALLQAASISASNGAYFDAVIVRPVLGR